MCAHKNSHFKCALKDETNILKATVCESECACVDILSPDSVQPTHKKETKAQQIECMRTIKRKRGKGWERENVCSMCEDSIVDGFENEALENGK